MKRFNEEGKNKIKANDLPLRKSIAENKVKTRKLKTFLAKIAQKKNRKANKKSHNKNTKLQFTNIEDQLIDDMMFELIEMEYYEKQLEKENRLFHFKYEISEIENICDCCNKQLDDVKFYYGCEQYLCKWCLNNGF